MKKRILLLTIIGLLGFATIGQTAQEKSFNDLTFKFTAVRSQVLPLEPIAFKVGLENNTDVPISVETNFSFSAGYISLEVKTPDGKINKVTHLSPLSGQFVLVSEEFKPGNKRERNEILSARVHEIFAEPGEYQIRATLKNNDGKALRSPWTSVSVAQLSEIDRNAYTQIRSRIDKDSLESISFAKWTPDELEEFIILNADTRYADYARFTLGVRHEKSQPDKAEMHLRKVRKDFVNYRIVKDMLDNLENKKSEEIVRKNN